MRQLVLSPRWIVWHVLTLGAMVTCGGLAAWQWQRAGSAMGSALNIGYGLQWPVFAVFFGVMWWRMLRMEAAQLREAAPEPAESTAGESTATESTSAEPAAAESTAAGSTSAEPTTAEPAERAVAAVPAPRTAPSPFGPRPRSAVPPRAGDDPELAAYNQMLAQLAARSEED